MKVKIIDKYNVHIHQTVMIVRGLLLIAVFVLWADGVESVHKIVALTHEYSKSLAIGIALIYVVTFIIIIITVAHFFVYRSDSYKLHKRYKDFDNTILYCDKDGVYLLGSLDSNIKFRAKRHFTDKVDERTIIINQCGVQLEVPSMFNNFY